MEESGTVEAGAPQQSPFPSDSVPTVVTPPIPVENSNTFQPQPDIHPPSVLPDLVPIPSAAPAPIPSPNLSDHTRKCMTMLPIVPLRMHFLFLVFGYNCLVFSFQQISAILDGFPLHFVYLSSPSVFVFC